MKFVIFIVLTLKVWIECASFDSETRIFESFLKLVHRIVLTV